MSYLRQISPWTRAMFAVVALAGAAIAVTVATASGADSDGSDAAAPGDVTFAPAPEFIQEWEDCMAEQGVDVPSPGEPFDGEPGVHEMSDEERAAFDACEDELPKRPPDAVMLAGPADSKALDEFRDCMSEHGVDLPDPPEELREQRLPAPSAEDGDAFDACSDQLPGPPPGVCPAPGAPPAPGMSDDE